MEEKKLITIFAIVGFFSILAEIIFPIDYHPYYWWHAFIGFDYIFGFIGGFILIGFSKFILFPLVKRKEDIYERGDEK